MVAVRMRKDAFFPPLGDADQKTLLYWRLRSLPLGPTVFTPIEYKVKNFREISGNGCQSLH